MKLNSKLAWGAAWTGLALVVAVPSADFLTGNQSTPAALITSDTDPVKATDPTKTASIPTAAPTPGLAPTPRQITLTPAATSTQTDAGTSPAPKVTVGAPASTTDEAETQTASLGISATNPPFPAPLAQRPVVTVEPAPVIKAPVVEQPQTVARIEQPVRTPLVEAADEVPLIIDEDNLADRVVIADPDRPTPPAGIANDPAERQSLDEYLAARGLLDEGSSSATVTYSDAGDEYDPDGFYLSEGPGNGNMTRAQWRRWLMLRGVNPDDLEPF